MKWHIPTATADHVIMS